MRRRAGFLIVAVCALAAACGGSGARVPTMSQSSHAFAALGGYQLQYAITAGGVTIHGDGAYQASAAVYARSSIEDDAGAPSAQFTASLFLPPDLYIQRGDGAWFVQSPWNIGLSADEVEAGDPSQPPIDYTIVTGAMRDVELRHDGKSQGSRKLTHYHGDVDVASVASIAALGGTGVAAADVWIDQATALPDEVELMVSGTGGFDATYTFGYNDAPTPPAPADARPLRDAEFPDAPCTGEALAGCLNAQDAIHGAPTCSGTGRRVCLVPLGQVSPAMVDALTSYYRSQLGLTVTVLAPQAVPANFEDPGRQQVAADRMLAYMRTLFPTDYADPQVVLIGLTPIDIYDGTTDFNYVFGVKGTPANPHAIVSSARMDPLFYSEPPDDTLLQTRTRKLVSKYIGLLFYQLPPSDDPANALYDHINGPDDVDRMLDLRPVGRS